VWDRGKACVTLDLDAALEGLDALSTAQLGVQACTPAADLLRLIASADVLVEDFAPSSPRQRLVEWRQLKRLNPRLVSCSITAYGKRGPWKDEPPIEDLVLARTGDTRPSVGLPPPLLGEQTAQVLREIGYSEDEIRSLHADGVVKTETV
jgi:crotonobetainyl-CoA:carnitine CoA-transferase CaiB-like acyl-CoA transferase